MHKYCTVIRLLFFLNKVVLSSTMDQNRILKLLYIWAFSSTWRQTGSNYSSYCKRNRNV